MLGFDEERYLRIQSGVVDQAERLATVVRDELDGGVTDLFFAGSGGAGILMLPAAALLESSSTLPVHVANPAELVEVGHARLGETSLVVLPSLSGTTPETVAAMAYCQERGATVIALTGHDSTPLAEGADHSVVAFAEDDTSCESFYLQSLVIALTVIRHRGENDWYDDVFAELDRLPAALIELKREFEPRAAAIAADIKQDDYHVLTGAGSTWAEAFYYGMCILEEMQWVRTRPVHASDFFHGTLELLEPGVSVILLKGEDGARSLVERVEKFAPTVTDRVLVLDAAELALPGVSNRLRTLVSPVLLAAALERVSAHLEVLRNHPLTTRRYYKRVAY
jgi:fructoselysine-6-phosphate deglycase